MHHCAMAVKKFIDSGLLLVKLYFVFVDVDPGMHEYVVHLHEDENHV